VSFARRHLPSLSYFFFFFAKRKSSKKKGRFFAEKLRGQKKGSTLLSKALFNDMALVFFLSSTRDLAIVANLRPVP